jgi:hypothetical protein
MTINAREFLVFVAIVTSAIVLQLRQHSDESPAVAHAQSTHRGLCNPTASALRNGPLRASCAPANDVRGASVQPKVRIQMWV